MTATRAQVARREPKPTEIQPGIYLDVAVAQHVMGIVRHSANPRYVWDDIKSNWARPAAYSTDLVDAWRVVGKMKADGWTFRLTVHPTDGVVAYFHRRTWSSSEHADTEPEAICRAALAAVSQTP